MHAGIPNENLKNLAQRFSSFNPCPQAIHVHLCHPLVTLRQQETVSVPQYSVKQQKCTIIFEIQMTREPF